MDMLLNTLLSFYRANNNENTNFRLLLLKIVTVTGLLSSFLLCIPLWTHVRIFPRAPVFEGLTVSPILETLLFIMLLCTLTAVLFNLKLQRGVFLSIFIVVLLGVLDQMRFQPWVYFYFAFLLLIGLSMGKWSTKAKQEEILNTARLMIGSIYFFSGLQKLNPAFFNEIYPWMVEPIITLFPPSVQFFALSLGYFVPILEIGIGLCLLIPKYRIVGIFGSLAMLAFVLFTIGPLGHNWNSVVWPWNIAIVLMVVILFHHTKTCSVKEIISTKNQILKKGVIVVFVILPFFSFLGLWDSYPSWSLYSGNITHAVVEVESSSGAILPPTAQLYLQADTVGDMELNILAWANDEINVPIYPETRVFKRIVSDLCANANEKNAYILTVYERPLLFQKWTSTKYLCMDLLKK